jgi:glycosyltransferase involved in cell wall biosynthesis
MKVAIVMPLGEQRGGAELLLRYLASEARNLNATWILVFLEDGPLAAELRDLGFHTTVINAGRLRQAHRWAAAIVRIARLLRAEKPDVVVAWMAKAHFYSGPAALLAGVPSIWCQHGLPRANEWLDRALALLPTRGIIVNSNTAAAAQRSLRPSHREVVVYPAVDLDEFDPARLPEPAEVRKELGLPRRVPIVGMVARLQRWKGVDVFVEAATRLRRVHPDIFCVVVGGEHALEPGYPAVIRRQIAEAQLDDTVLLAGRQPEVAKWMHAMDVVVLPSRDEPFGMVIVEAMALGKPVVAGDSAGPSEIVRSGDDGLLVPYGNADALANAVMRYLDDPDFAQHVADRARLRARQFSTRRYGESFLGAVEALVSPPP